MNRTIVIIAIGYMIGIISGLYSKMSIALFYVSIFLIYLIIKYSFSNVIRRLKTIKLMCRYLKASVIKRKVIILIVITSIISNIHIQYLNNKYDKFYSNVEEKINLIVTVISDPIEKEYNYQYIVKGSRGEYKNKKFILYVKKDKKKPLKYGDVISLDGDFVIPEGQRNYGGFNYKEYLKTKKTYGSIKANSNNIETIDRDKCNAIFRVANTLRRTITENSKKILPKRTSGVLSGILIRRHDRYIRRNSC